MLEVSFGRRLDNLTFFWMHIGFKSLPPGQVLVVLVSVNDSCVERILEKAVIHIGVYHGFINF